MARMGFKRRGNMHFLNFGRCIQRDFTWGKSDLEDFGGRAKRGPRQINAAYARVQINPWPWGWQCMYLGGAGGAGTRKRGLLQGGRSGVPANSTRDLTYI